MRIKILSQITQAVSLLDLFFYAFLLLNLHSKYIHSNFKSNFNFLLFIDSLLQSKDFVQNSYFSIFFVSSFLWIFFECLNIFLFFVSLASLELCEDDDDVGIWFPVLAVAPGPLSRWSQVLHHVPQIFYSCLGLRLASSKSPW